MTQLPNDSQLPNDFQLPNNSITQWLPITQRLNYPMTQLLNQLPNEERSGSVDKCLTQDQGGAGSSPNRGTPIVLDQVTLSSVKYWLNPGKPTPTWLKNCLLGRKNQNKQSINYQMTFIILWLNYPMALNDLITLNYQMTFITQWLNYRYTMTDRLGVNDFEKVINFLQLHWKLFN